MSRLDDIGKRWNVEGEPCRYDVNYMLALLKEAKVLAEEADSATKRLAHKSDGLSHRLYLHGRQAHDFLANLEASDG